MTVGKSLDKTTVTPGSTKTNEIFPAPFITKATDLTNKFLFKSQSLFPSTNTSKSLERQKLNLPLPKPTSTTPTEEDVANVKVEDVQFIHAPLVAAFTVHQNDKGQPHKVIPIFGNKNQLKEVNKQQTFNTHLSSLEQKQRNLEQEILYLQEKRRLEEEKLKQQLIAQETKNQVPVKPALDSSVNSFVDQTSKKPKTEVTFQNAQLFTEQQLPLQPLNVKFNPDLSPLQSFQQQLPLQQNSFSFNTPQIVKTENVKIQKAESFPVHQNFQTEPIRQQNTIINTQPSISIQPSLSFQPGRFTSGIVPTSQVQYNELQFAGQQPPFKEPVNFQQTQIVPQFFTQNRNNAFTQQQLPLQFATQQFDTFHYNDNYLQELQASLRTQLPPLPPSPAQSTRVFRQESQTGNFGINNFSSNRNRFQQNQFNNVQTLKSSSFSFRPESRPAFNPGPQFNNDARLKNLFYQTGFGQGRSQEDFNIISKVLSLDHTR